MARTDADLPPHLRPRRPPQLRPEPHEAPVLELPVPRDVPREEAAREPAPPADPFLRR